MLFHVTGDRIGDALIKWPVIQALRNTLPDHRLVWMAGLRTSVFRGPLRALANGVIDEVIECAGIGVSWKEFAKRPPDGHYDIIVSTEPKWRNHLLLRRISHQVLISPVWNFGFSDRKPSPAEQFPRSAFDQLVCLAELACGEKLAINRRFDVDPNLTTIATDLLPAGQDYVGFAPGAAGSGKRWPLDRFIAAAAAQLERGRIPVFFLGPSENDLQSVIAAQLPLAQFPEQDARAEDTGPLLTIALARRLIASVANDSGGGHLLAAGGQPTVSLFGRTSAEKFRSPYDASRTVICAAEYGGTDLALIPAARVIEAVDTLVRATER